MNVSAVDCRSYTLKGLQPNGTDPLPVGALLEIAYNCHNAIKGKIDEQLRATGTEQWSLADDRGRT